MPKPPSSGPKPKTKPAAKKPAAAAPADPPAGLKLTRFASFTPDAVPRAQIKNAPYNPRRITDSARQRLRANIARVGLMEPVIWNRRTGHVVGGHQRLAQLDALEGSPDYLVPVAAVDLDEATERAQNVFLNNGEAQGDWDLVALADLLKGMPEPEFTGFDRGDLYQLFGCDPTLSAPAPEAEDPEPAADQDFGRRAAEGKDREAGDFYLVVVFGADAERRAFTDALGLPDNRYIAGKKLLDLLTAGRDGEGEGEAGGT